MVESVEILLKGIKLEYEGNKLLLITLSLDKNWLILRNEGEREDGFYL